MIDADPNMGNIELVAEVLEKFSRRFVFVGGCAAGLLVTDSASGPVRSTTDVDIVTEIACGVSRIQLDAELRGAGFSHDKEDGVICRWSYKGILVDVMPTDPKVLGFGSHWYPEAVEHATEIILPSGRGIYLIRPEYLLATKVEAFQSRGNGDFQASRDIEDIVAVIDGRPEIVAEVHALSGDLREFIREEVEHLIATRQFVSSIRGHLRPNTILGREEVVIQRLRSIAGL